MANAPKVRIVHANVVGVYGYKRVNTDKCGICRNSLTFPCMVHIKVPETHPPALYADEYKYKGCSTQTGECGHTFHSCCIVDYISLDSTCPYCRKSFERVTDHHALTYSSYLSLRDIERGKLLSSEASYSNTV